jgi:hypothetical protein
MRKGVRDGAVYVAWRHAFDRCSGGGVSFIRRIPSAKPNRPGVGVVLCECGREVVCYGFTNTCECGRDYNHAGQGLAPRACWGEETNETAGDILMAEAAGFPEDGEDY